MQFRELKHLPVVALVAVGLALAGCGGGGDTAEAPTVTEPTGPTQEELDAARAAAEEAAAQAAAEQAAREAAEQELADQQAADAAAAATTMGKQLHRAMDHNGAAAGADPLMNLAASGTDPDATGYAARSRLTASGLVVGDIKRKTGDTASGASPVMKAAGDALDAVNGWEGQHYAHSAAGVSDEARVYTFKMGPPGKAAAEIFGDDRATGSMRPRAEIAVSGEFYNARTRTLTFVDASTSRRFKSDSLPTAGTATHRPNSSGAIAFEGTYDGVPGTYRCAPADGATTCTTTVAAGGTGITLGAGSWTFKHDADATTVIADSAYQYFGWWLKKVDGVPNAASAFFGTAGSGTQTAVAVQGLNGSATYSGSAAGKWAIDDPVAGSGDAGHFTADVALSAKFGTVTAVGNESGISGSLTNFMANEEAVPWTVTLRRATWGADGDATSATRGTFSRATGGTVWSIDGRAADPSGSWSGRMYDDAATDNSNVPTVAIGMFHSEAGSTHRMVGGFGARKD